VKRFAAIVLAWVLTVYPLAAHAGPVAHRIVSLVPSLTEDLFALGVGDRVVGVSAYTDHPAAAKKLPEVASFSSIDAERILTLHPDLVVGIPSQAALVTPLERAKLHVVLFRDDTLGDIYATLDRLGTLVGRSRAANALVRRLRDETDRLERSARRKQRPSVFVVLDVAPIYTVGRGSYINALIRLAGGRNAAKLDGAYGRYSAEALLNLQPDVVIADPLVNLRSVIGREPWRSLRAVRHGDVAYIPDPGILLHPGPRYNEGLRWLIGVLRRVRAQS
jgi:iron complex transport system substrate-binding protein